MLASIGASRLRTEKATESAYVKRWYEEDPNKRHDEGQITLANLPYCKQNRLQFSHFSVETNWP